MTHFWDIFPDGASRKQYEALQDMARLKYKAIAEKQHTFDVAIIHQNALKGDKEAFADQILLEEISVASMCDSIFAYGSILNVDLSDRYLQNRRDDFLDYVDRNTATEYTQKVIDCMKRHYKNCFVARGTYTDSEGCSYNSFSEDPDERIGVEY